MPENPNPYAAPSPEPRIRWTWGNAAFAQLAFITQFVVLIGYCVLAISMDDAALNGVQRIRVGLHAVLSSVALLSFVVVLFAACLEKDWPLRLRCGLVAVDFVFLFVLMAFAWGLMDLN